VSIKAHVFGGVEVALLLGGDAGGEAAQPLLLPLVPVALHTK